MRYNYKIIRPSPPHDCDLYIIYMHNSCNQAYAIQREEMENRLEKTKEHRRNTNRGFVNIREEEEIGELEMRIVLTKKQLRQLMALIGGNGNGNGNHLYPTSLPTIEQLRRLMQIKRNCSRRGGRCSWRPILQSIPEEV